MKRFLTIGAAIFVFMICFMIGSEPAGAVDNGIPVVRLNIDEDEFEKVISSPDHSYQAAGSISIDVPDNYTGEFSDEVLSDTGELALSYIRGRGNFSWQARIKKPFKLKLEKGADLLGMGSNKHWVLLANAHDGTLLRNRLAMYMGRELGSDFVPQMAAVDLEVNGEYKGSYVLSEHVRKGKSRVNISDDGYLLALEPYDDELGENIITTERGVDFLTEDPFFASDDPDDQDKIGTTAQKEFITEYLQNTEDSVFADDRKDNNGNLYSDNMDLRSAAKYWWIQEFATNCDAFSTSSTYLYKDDGGKLCWGPLWDFDMAFMQKSGTEGFNNTHMLWLDHLRAYDRSYQEILREEWEGSAANGGRGLKQIIGEMIEDGGIIDQYVDEISGSRTMDRKYGFAVNSAMMGTSEKQTDDLKEYYRARYEWINSNIGSALDEVHYDVSFYDNGYFISAVKVGIADRCLKKRDFPADPVRKGYRFTGWFTRGGDRVDVNSRIRDNMKLEAKFVKDTSAKAANTLAVKGKTVKIRAKKLKKKAQKIKRTKALKVSKAKGSVTYKLVSVKKAKYRKYFKVNKKTGKITVKKKLRKGTYKVKIKVTAAGDSKNKAGSKTVTVRIKVR